VVRSRKPKQLELDYRPWGGKRKGAGRKPASPRSRVQHAKRARHDRHHPLHVTLRLRRGLPSLRNTATHDAILRALVAGSAAFGLQVVHYCVLSNHIHLICEAETARSITTGLSALVVRLARALNRIWRRRGGVFADRFHVRPLRSPRDVRNTLAYVLQNALHHGIRHPGGIDPFSSARWFDGWSRAVPAALLKAGGCPLPRPRTWLLSEGWRRHGALDPLLSRDHCG